jgi:hypothetical protein
MPVWGTPGIFQISGVLASAMHGTILIHVKFPQIKPHP